MKKIGIPGYTMGDAFGVGIPYMRFIESLDAEVIILSPSSDINTSLNLLILPGGPDIAPSRYDHVPSWETSRQDPIREHFDIYHLPRYVEAKVPIFGICRGIQAIALAFGATLNQHMYHETNKDDSPEDSVHGLCVIGNEKLKIKVNSRHHQSIDIRELPKDIIVLATHDKHKYDIEAIRIKDYPICGVQYHPENLYDWTGVKYARDLIKSIIK